MKPAKSVAFPSIIKIVTECACRSHIGENEELAMVFSDPRHPDASLRFITEAENLAYVAAGVILAESKD